MRNLRGYFYKNEDEISQTNNQNRKIDELNQQKKIDKAAIDKLIKSTLKKQNKLLLKEQMLQYANKILMEMAQQQRKIKQELNHLKLKDQRAQHTLSLIKQQYEDPITYEQMINPSILPCGHGLDKQSAIKTAQKFQSCPLCRKKYKSSDIIQDYTAKNVLKILHSTIK